MSNNPDSKQEAPERIWINNPAEATEHDQRWWYENPMAFPTVEYVRASVAAVEGDADRELAERLRMLLSSAFIIGHSHGPSKDYQVQLRFRTLEVSQRCHTIIEAIAHPEHRESYIRQGVLEPFAAASSPAPVEPPKPAETPAVAREAAMRAAGEIRAQFKARFVIPSEDELAAIITRHLAAPQWGRGLEPLLELQQALCKIVRIADVGSAQEFDDSGERLRAIATLAAAATTSPEGDCEHKWIDVRNESRYGW